MKTLLSIILTLIVVAGIPHQFQASANNKTAAVPHKFETPCTSNFSTAFAKRIQSGTIAIEDDIYMIVNTQGFALTVKTVRIYTDASKSNFVMGLEGCASSYCSYNLVIAGLATGTYFVEVETYSSTFFSGWVTYE